MLSLVHGSKVSIISADGRSKLTPVEELDSSFSVYDTYGQERTLRIKGVTKEKVYLLKTEDTEGEVFVGESHKLYCREGRSGFHRRVPISSMVVGEDDLYVKSTQRRVHLPELREISDNLTVDGDSLIVTSKYPSALPHYMEILSGAGIRIKRRGANIVIDQRRPACFASKLLNGSFEENLEETVSRLTATGVIYPTMDSLGNYVASVMSTGILSEGASIFQEVRLKTPRKVAKEMKVYHITGITLNFPVELSWFSA